MDILNDQRFGGEALRAPTDFNPFSPNAASKDEDLDEREQTERDSNAAYANMIFSLAKENLLDLYK